MKGPCTVCLKPSTQQCSRCKEAFYCGAQCQFSDWKAVHKKECCRVFETEAERVAAGREVLTAIKNNSTCCKHLGKQFLKTDGAVAVSVWIRSHYEKRMALAFRLRCTVFTDDIDLKHIESYQKYKPRAGLDYVLHVQVGRSDGICSSVAVPIPFDGEF